MDRIILATYCDKDSFSFVWLENEEDAEEWVEVNKDKYTQIEVIKVNVIDVIYQSDDMIDKEEQQ